MSKAHWLQRRSAPATRSPGDGTAFCWNIWAFLALIFASTLVTVGLLVTASDELDSYEVKKTTTLAETAVAQATKHLQTIARDYGHWDDMVDKLVVAYDKEWSANTIMATLTENFSISASFIVNGEDGLVNAYCAPSICDADESLNNTKVQSHFSGDIDHALKLVRQKAISKDLSGAQGVIAFKGGLYAFGIAPVMPLNGSFPAYETEIKAGRATTFLLLIELNSDYVSKIGQDYLLHDAHLVGLENSDAEAPHDGDASFPLRSPDGTVAATLHWQVDSPSKPFLKLIGLPVLAVSLCVIGLSLVFAYFLRRMAAQNNAARLRAEQADKAKTEFLGTMSHELRTPLNAIVGFSQLIMQEALGAVGHPDYKIFAQDICKSGQHLTDMVTDVLDLTKLKAGMFDVNPRPIRLGGSIGEVVEALRQQAADSRLTLTCTTASDDFVIADPVATKRVLSSLVSNAIKFTPHGGHVEVALLDGKDGMIGVAVKDNGIGISPDQQAAILNPFEQADSSISRAYEGMGLGLSITKLLMERQGGRVSLESAVGGGTTVTFQFKQATPAERTETDARPARRSMLARSPTVSADDIRRAG